MKPPLKRAAWALCSLDGHPSDIKMDGKPMWQDYLPEVCAVLRALRDPSAEMIAAADDLACSVGTVAQWQAMIAGVLDEETRGTKPMAGPEHAPNRSFSARNEGGGRSTNRHPRVQISPGAL